MATSKNFKGRCYPQKGQRANGLESPKWCIKDVDSSLVNIFSISIWVEFLFSFQLQHPIAPTPTPKEKNASELGMLKG